MEQCGTATSDIEGGDKVGVLPSQPGGRQPYTRVMQGRWAHIRDRQDRGCGLGRSAGRDEHGLRGRIFGPNIVMSHRDRGIPKMTRCTDSDDMNPERAMHMKCNLIHGRGGSDLQGTPPLTPVGSFLTKLAEQLGGVGRHKL